MDLAFSLQALFQRVHRVLQEFLLVLVFLLNVRVDLAALRVGAFDEA